MWFKYKGRIEIKNSKNNQGRHFVYPFFVIYLKESSNQENRQEPLYQRERGWGEGSIVVQVL